MKAAARSMTGYGRASAAGRDVAVEVEVRSVNARHLAVRCRLPSEWMRLEGPLEALVKRGLRRGNVDLLARIQVKAASPRPRIDRAVLAVYSKALAGLGGGDAAALLRLPGVITLDERPLPARRVERLVLDAAGQALAALVAARETEGGRLVVAMGREVAALERHLGVVRRLLPRAVRRHQEGLQRRLAALLGRALDRDDPVLQRELAVLADRSDVTEELDRLDSHVATVKERLGRAGEIGRELEFLLQEIGREANTLAAKSSDVTLTGRAIRIKSCNERLREQAANLE